MKKTVIILLILIMGISSVMLPVTALAESVEDRLTEEQAEATPLVDKNGNEIAFEVKGNAQGNGGGAIFVMVAVVVIGIWLIADGIRSYIRNARKESRDRFKNKNE